MAETDILNPTTQYWASITDSPNPSYGWVRKSANNAAVAKTRLGPPYTRESLNNGFAFALRYENRPWKTILRLKHFYEQFKGGYFTYIDYDGGARHHVGRFTAPIDATQMANGTYTVQQAIFEEMPRARMLEYPADFVNWSRTVNVVDDFLNQTVATNSVQPYAWLKQLNPTLVAPSANDPTAYEIFNANPTFYSSSPANYDWAQIQYVGWGFRMQFRTAPTLGQIAVEVDGVFICILDLSTGAGVPTGGMSTLTLPAGVTLVNGLLQSVQMPLDMHRVKVTAYQAGASGGLGALFPAVTVIV